MRCGVGRGEEGVMSYTSALINETDTKCPVSGLVRISSGVVVVTNTYTSALINYSDKNASLLRFTVVSP